MKKVLFYWLMSMALAGGAQSAENTDTDESAGSMVASETVSVIGDSLTVEDKILIERVRDFCVDNDIDMKHAESFATDLAAYRLSPAVIRTAELYDKDGKKINVNFSQEDMQVASRIYQAMFVSDLDRGYVISRITPFGRFVNLQFLEKVVNSYQKLQQMAVSRVSSLSIPEKIRS